MLNNRGEIVTVRPLLCSPPSWLPAKTVPLSIYLHAVSFPPPLQYGIFSVRQRNRLPEIWRQLVAKFCCTSPPVKDLSAKMLRTTLHGGGRGGCTRNPHSIMAGILHQGPPGMASPGCQGNQFWKCLELNSKPSSLPPRQPSRGSQI